MVSRRLKDKNESLGLGLGLGLEEKVLQSAAGRKSLAPPYYSQRGVCVSLNAFFHFRLCYFYVICVFCRLVVLVRLSVPV